MKKTTKPLKLLAALALLLCVGYANAQCAINLTAQAGLNGDMILTVVSTPSTTTYSAINWDFGNGNTLNTSAPNTSLTVTETYTADGVYNVTVTTAGACSMVVTQSIAVLNAGCNLTPIFSMSSATAAGSAYYTNSSTGTTSATTYTMAWGDGTFDGPIPHIYPNNGVYTATLYAYANTTPNCISSATQQIIISNACALGTASFSYSAGPNGQVTFFNTTASTGTNTTFDWFFGPTSSYSVVGVDTTSHTFPSNGTYTVTLLVTEQCSVVVTQLIPITNITAPCQLAASFNSSDLGMGNISFNNFTTGTVSGTTYSWDFGDGTSSASASPAHTYSSNGTFSVILTANNNGTASCISSDTTVINVTSYCSLGPPALFIIPGANGTASVFCATNGTNSSTVYYYDFGNGSSAGPLSVPGTTTSYSTNGSYVVSVMVMNMGPTTCTVGTSQTAMITNTFNGVPCNLQVYFGATTTIDSVSYFNNNTIGTDSTTQYLWYFGDGTTGTGQYPGHVYPNNGNYTATLTAYNDSLCSATGTVPAYISFYSCTANASFSVMPSGTPHNWYVIPFDTTFAAVEWNWGDGTTSDTLFTSHTYSAAGIYTLCMTVTTTCGSVDSKCDYPVYISKGTDANQVIQVNVVTQSEIVAGIKNNAAQTNNYALYPNPANGSFNVSMNNINSSKASISVYNLIGKLIYKNDADVSGGTLLKEIDLSNEANGIYFVKVSTDNQTYTKKLVVNH